MHLDSVGHGEPGSPTGVDDGPEFFKEHENVESGDVGSETFLATSQPVAVSNGQATCRQ